MFLNFFTELNNWSTIETKISALTIFNHYIMRRIFIQYYNKHISMSFSRILDCQISSTKHVCSFTNYMKFFNIIKNLGD